MNASPVMVEREELVVPQTQQQQQPIIMTEIELERIGWERWSKLREHFGLCNADLEAYADFQALNRSKVKQLLGHVPSVDEVFALRERNRNSQINNLLERWNTEMDEVVQSRRRSQTNCIEADPNSAKSSRLLGMSDKDLCYYRRFDKAVRVLGDAPVRAD